MYGNELPPEALAVLRPGDTVILETARDGWTGTAIHTGTVAKLTPSQIVVHYPGARGTVEARIRRKDNYLIGARGVLLDPMHPTTVRALANQRREARQSRIDGLAARWSRERDNLDLLRQLQVAVSEYLDAETDQ